MNYWGTWCGWCKKELPGFAAASEAYGDQVQFLYINYEQGISGSQAVNKANAYLEKEQIDITTYYDNDEDAVSTYGVYSFPMTFLIDAQGNVAAGHAGYLSEEEIKSVVQQVLLK